MRKLIYLLIAAAMFAACGNREQADVQAPLAKKVKHVTKIHGYTLEDDYYWMRNRDSVEVMQYIEAENDYTTAMTAHLDRNVSKIFKEMKKRLNENDMTVPEKEGSYLYYSRIEKGKEYRIYCRKKDEEKAPEEILLDVNELAGGHGFFAVGLMKISPNEDILAYTYDTDGSENYKLAIKDLKTGELLSDDGTVIDDFEWLNDNSSYIYTVSDETNRPYIVKLHKSGTADRELYREKDGKFWMWIYKSKDKDYLFVGLGSKMTSEIRFVPTDKVEQGFKVFSYRKKGVEYYVSHNRGLFYVFTNENARNFKLMSARREDIRNKNAWQTIMGHDENRTLIDYEIFKRHLVIYVRENGYKKVLIKDYDDNKDRYVEFPEEICDVYPGRNSQYDTDLLRLTYTSMVTPSTVYDYNMSTGEFTTLKERRVKGYKKEKYTARRVYATAEDGTQIPITLVYSPERINGPAPLYLYAYGAYGDSMDPYFSSVRLTLLDRGFIVATPHIRGGGDMGRHWYDQGKLLKKKNSFTDYIACAEYLVKEGYTSSDRLVASGGSAGGLLMGAVVNMRPDLFSVVVASVPFVDAVNTMLDPTIPLTVAEYEEWGNPGIRRYFEYILSYSPYDNVKKSVYPDMLITGGLNDPRVQYWEPLKWTAKLRDTVEQGDNVILLKMNTGAGHMGASGRYGWLKELAFEYAFILDRLAID